MGPLTDNKLNNSFPAATMIRRDAGGTFLPRRMRALWLTGERQMESRVDAVPAPGPGDLLVRVQVCGICGSDLSTYRGTHPYKRPPVILGHEMAGEVVAVGEGVRGFRIGQWVTTASFDACGRCDECRRGAEHLCTAKCAISDGGWQGSFAEYMRLTEKSACVLPAGVAPERGALAEPLSVGLHALRLTAGIEGRRLAIIGAGNIGLATLLCARRLGVRRSVCIDIGGDAKRRLALACGADDFLDARDAYVPGRIEECLGALADVTLVASGHASAVSEAIAITRPGGEVAVVAYFEQEVALDLNTLVRSERKLLFSALSNAADFRQILAWLGEGSLDPLPMVTHGLPLKEADRAMRLMDEGGTAAGKILLFA